MPGQMDLKKQVLDTMKTYQMIEEGGHIVAAVSGGADSACLLYVLNELKEELGFSLEAFHVNHGLRGAEADHDEAFTEELCRRLKIPVKTEHVKEREYGKAHGMSEEEAGRKLRYEALRRQAAKWKEENPEGRVQIATAHHQDDSSETILYNLFRGSGLKGLGGIRPISGDIIRPLIRNSRSDIEKWMRERGYTWCEDSTNRDSCYARNRIRNEILPLAESVHDGAAEGIIRAGGFIAQADEYLEGEAERIIDDFCFFQKGAVGIRADELEGKAAIVKAYVIRRMLRLVSCPMKDVGAVHLEAAAALLGGRVGKKVDLPHGYAAWNGYDTLFVGRRECQEEKEEKRLPDIRFAVFPYEKGMEIPKNQYTKWFDYDKMKNAPLLRFRRTGDYFLLPGGGKKSVKSYMIDEKIPTDIRDRIPVLAEENHVIWIIGYRISEYYKVTAQTKHILEAVLDGGENDGR